MFSILLLHMLSLKGHCIQVTIMSSQANVCVWNSEEQLLQIGYKFAFGTQDSGITYRSRECESGNWTKDVTSQNHRKRRYQESAVGLTGGNLRSCNGSKSRIWSALGQRLDENGYTEVVSQPLKFFWQIFLFCIPQCKIHLKPCYRPWEQDLLKIMSLKILYRVPVEIIRITMYYLLINTLLHKISKKNYRLIREEMLNSVS